jgi:exoribonuclease II
MNYLIVSDGLDYKIAKILEKYKNNYQVELIPSKIKKKIKSEQQIYLLDLDSIISGIKNINNSDIIDNVLIQINTLIQDIDIMLLRDIIGDNFIQKFHINELANIYFGNNPSQIQITALLFTLAQYSSEFHNYMDGYFSKCSEEERNERQIIALKQQEQDAKYQQYITSILDAYQNKTKFVPWSNTLDIYKLLSKPDKISLEYKALLHVSNTLKISQLELCHAIGLVENLADFFVSSFIRENFPTGLSHPKIDSQLNLDDILYTPNLKIFSIDDETTTEIDDAFSVQTTESGYIVGIHIAAPALNHELAEVVADKISTIYYPGNKFTMLPLEVIDEFSLQENQQMPVVSIYFILDVELNILSHTSQVELINVSANLRIEKLERLFNLDTLGFNHGYPFEAELKILYKFALKLEDKRGKPSVNTTVPDYNFSFENERVIITPRIRGNPIDKVVSELMILANCTWGRMLTNSFIPAIYRVKEPGYPVKMVLTPGSHTGLNVDYYTWATSPLRRSADYINQYQIINLILNQKKHYLNNNSTLLTIVETFDVRYTKFINFQNKMERYWALRYLLQEQITEIDAIFTYKLKVHLKGVPIDLDVQHLTTIKPKNTIIRLKIYNINLSTLDFNFKILGN